jgi:signal transduction histidine kinase/DNA-binding NarL/FixJ family response regulator
MTKSILVVEDEPITALDLRARLRGLGYTVPAIASSGEEAIRKAGEIHPDLVLMDIRLKTDMDGIEAARAIRSQLDIPVVYLTAYTDEETVQRAGLTEPFGYLLKPFEERELHTTIAIAFHKHKAEVALRESERRLRLYSRRLETLHEMDKAMLAADSPEKIAQAGLRHIRDLVPCRQTNVVVFDSEAEATVLAALDGNGTHLARGLRIMRTRDQDMDELRQGIPYLVEDLSSLPSLCPLEQVLFQEGVRSYVNVPLLVQGELIGSLNLGLEQPDGFQEESIEIISEVANSLALAIHHARLHERVEQHAAQLEVRNKELDAFAHTVAHDLKDPLGLILGFADVLERDHARMTAEELQSFLAVISKHGFKMNNIINELLLLAEVRKLDVTIGPLDMESIVENAQMRLMHLIEEYQPEICVPELWPVAMGYAPWVEEIWINYLSNAFKYGGQPLYVELGATDQGDWVRFWVRDNGPGISPEAQSRLFTPFTRLAQVRAQGHGLGLSIVRRITEKLGGQVGVESEGVDGKGSVFSFTLPRADTRAGGIPVPVFAPHVAVEKAM